MLMVDLADESVNSINPIYSFYRLTINRFYPKHKVCRDVAQSGRAQRSGRWGRRFKSSRPDHLKESFLLYIGNLATDTSLGK